MNRLSLLFIILLSLSGCSMFSSTPAPLPVVAIDCPVVEYDDPTFELKAPIPVAWQDLEIVILTPDTTDAEFDKLDPTQRVFFAVTDAGYEAMSMNYAELKRYIKDQKNIIIAYKKYFEEKK